MTLTILLSMISFSFVMSITPGPVNIMIISSGINNGFRKTFSFISGATIGFTLLLFIIGLGLSNIYILYPKLFSIMEIIGSLFIMYMGYKITRSTDDLKTQSHTKQTPKFYEGFLLQWINPKAWIASISGVSMFITNNTSLLIFIIIYFFVCYLSLSFWGVVGEKATIFFNTKMRLKIFNVVMGSILILSSFSLFLSNLLNQ
jgi:threonine/homoserine/homoserine lactone efflux protein